MRINFRRPGDAWPVSASKVKGHYEPTASSGRTSWLVFYIRRSFSILCKTLSHLLSISVLSSQPTSPEHYNFEPTATMVRLLNIAAILFAGFVTVQGCTHCQCLYNDGSHCCVQEVREYSSHPSSQPGSQVITIDHSYPQGAKLTVTPSALTHSRQALINFSLALRATVVARTLALVPGTPMAGRSAMDILAKMLMPNDTRAKVYVEPVIDHGY